MYLLVLLTLMLVVVLQEPTTDGFEWSSDSDEAIDRTLTFELASYAMVDAVEIKFPAGNVYVFDLVLYDDKIRGEAVMTIPVCMVCSALLQYRKTTGMLLLVFLR